MMFIYHCNKWWSPIVQISNLTDLINTDFVNEYYIYAFAKIAIKII